MKTNELSGAALDWAVAKAGGTTNIDFVWELMKGKFNPSTNWAQGGKIIERERIELRDARGDGWAADDNLRATQYGETPLVAAMRCYVASKLGDNIEIPEELK